MRTRKQIPSDLVIELMSNMNGTVSFADTKSNTNAYLSFNGIDDTDECTYEEIRTLLKQRPNLLKRGYIVISDAWSIENPEFKVDDLLKNLNLYDLYRGAVYPVGLEKFILNTKYERMVDKIRKCDQNLYEIIIERTVYLYRKGLLTDSVKMDYIQSLVPNIKLFR